NGSSGSDRVIPCRADWMVLNMERGHLSVRNLLAGRIVARIEDRLHDQASGGLRATNECDHCVPSPQRHAGPIAADLAEQPMLDGVPLRATRRVVTHGHGQTEAIADLDLQSLLPRSGLAAIAAT